MRASRHVDKRALKSQILKLTAELRSGAEVFWSRLRELLHERGVEPGETVLTQLHTEDTNRWLGIVVTEQRRVFLFLYDDPLSGRASVFTQWTELTGDRAHFEYRAFADEIEAGLNLVAEGPI